MADPAQGTTSATPIAAGLATQGLAPSAPSAAPGSTIEGSHEAHVASTSSGDLGKTADGQAKTTAVEHAPPAPSPTSPSSSSSGHETMAPLNEKSSNEGESIDEKVVERMQAQKQREKAHSAEKEGDADTADGKGGKKKKKGKPFFDKRSPLEIALEDPELAHLSPEYRKIVAEQMYVVSLPSSSSSSPSASPS